MTTPYVLTIADRRVAVPPWLLVGGGLHTPQGLVEGQDEAAVTAVVHLGVNTVVARKCPVENQNIVMIVLLILDKNVKEVL